MRNRDRGINNFEATYQQLAIAWLDGEIMRLAEELAQGSHLLAPDPTAIAMGYAQSVQRIRTLRDVKDHLLELEKKLMGA